MLFQRANEAGGLIGQAPAGSTPVASRAPCVDPAEAHAEVVENILTDSELSPIEKQSEGWGPPQPTGRIPYGRLYHESRCGSAFYPWLADSIRYLVSSHGRSVGQRRYKFNDQNM